VNILGSSPEQMRIDFAVYCHPVPEEMALTSNLDAILMDDS